MLHIGYVINLSFLTYAFMTSKGNVPLHDTSNFTQIAKKCININNKIFGTLQSARAIVRFAESMLERCLLMKKIGENSILNFPLTN